MLRKTIPVILFFILFSTSSVFAANEHRPYIEAQIGAVFAEENDAGPVSDMDFDTGIASAVAIGLDHGWRYAHARSELEFAYHQSDVDGGSLSGLKVTDGEVEALSLLLNLFYTIETGYSITPYIMGGLGVAFLDIDNVTIAGTSFIEDSEFALAYQTGVGLDLPLTDSLSLDLSYRYFGTADKEFENNTVSSSTKYFDFRYETHNALQGLRYKF